MGLKRSFLLVFRAFVFAVSAFALLAVLGTIKIHRSADVALFILGLTVFWILIERVFLNIRAKKRNGPRRKI